MGNVIDYQLYTNPRKHAVNYIVIFQYGGSSSQMEDGVGDSTKLRVWIRGITETVLILVTIQVSILVSVVVTV